MKKFISLLSASTKGQLNIFKIKGVGKSKYLIFICLFVILLSSSYMYAETLMKPLHEASLAYIGISLFAFAVVIITIAEGVYKSQGIIFDAKDNNMLFSMPVDKSHILISRFLKILYFNYIFEFIFLAPCILKYSLLIKPDVSFYLLSILFFILLPLIPLVISCIIGYIIKSVSVKFRNKKLVQTIITLLFFITIMFVSFSMEGLVNNIVAKATSINDLISKIYLPIGLYIELINNFNLLKLIQLMLISIIPFIVFVVLFSYNYDKIINYGKENSSKRKRNEKVKSTGIIKALLKKEIKTYFGLPVYIINTIISPLMMLLFSGFLLVKFDDTLNTISTMVPGISLPDISKLSPYLFVGIILILLALSAITASSISLEGKKYPLLKSLPVKEKDIFLSKILLSDLIIIPAFLIGAIIYIIKFEIFNYSIIFMIISCIILPHINGQLGLIINLTFPKLEYNSEVEVVKQSIAVLATMIVNLLFAIALIFSFYKLAHIININLLIIIYIIILIMITLTLNSILSKYGIRRFKELD